MIEHSTYGKVTVLTPVTMWNSQLSDQSVAKAIPQISRGEFPEAISAGAHNVFTLLYFLWQCE